MRHLAVAAVVDEQKRVLMMWRHRFVTDTWGWELPMGLIEPDETPEQAALREVEEETSLVCELGPEVAVSEYADSAGRPKRVRYFQMTPAAGSEAKPQNEVDDVRWLQRDAALALLSYARDSAVVEAVADLAAG
jgi:8-oxo-dGTP pyrophosphatase MutT (NUDIX family)